MINSLNNLKFYRNLSHLKADSKSTLDISSWSGAVLVLIVEDFIVFIKRSESMPSHKGQIGFFGGHKKPDEVDPVDCALREFEEESNIKKGKVSVIGTLEPVQTSNKSLIIPILGELMDSKRFFLDRVKSNGEWDDLILCNMKSLSVEKSWKYSIFHFDSPVKVRFFSLNDRNSLSKKNKNDRFNYVLWGATGKMVSNLFQIHT